MQSTRWIHICGLVIVLLVGGCAKKQVGDRLAENARATTTLHADVQNLEQRVLSMEGRLAALSSDVGSLEVKTRKGAKTHYVVAPAVKAAPYVPVTASPAAVAAPASAPYVPLTASTVQPITASPASAAAPAAVPAAARAVAPTAPAQGIGAPPATIPTGVALSLPPTAAPSPAQNIPASAPRPASTSTPAPAAAAKPVPVQSPVSLALPPESSAAVFGQPAVPAASAPAASAAQAPQGSQGVQGSGAPAVAQSPAHATAPVSLAPLAPKGKGEESAYNAALALVRGGQTAEAIKRFTAFLQEYPSGRYAPNAYYWMGECLYAQRKYPDALLQFKDVAARYPRHHKTADALLKAGMTYDRLGDKENAALQYKALMTDFPNSEAARRVKGRGAAR